jgi:hypothetical protein
VCLPCVAGFIPLAVPLQGRWPPFEELAALDPEVYRSLLQLKRYEGHVEDLTLDFTGGTTWRDHVLGPTNVAQNQIPAPLWLAAG